MSKRFPWLRLYDDTLTDRKLRAIAREAEMPFTCVLGTWIGLLLLANLRDNTRGKIMITDTIGMTTEHIAPELDIEPAVLGRLIKLFGEFGMLEVQPPIVISNWDKRQRMSDSGAERVRRHRARKKEEEKKEERSKIYIGNALQKQDVTSHVTLQNVTQPLHDVTSPSQDSAYHDMHAAIAGTVKDTYADYINGDAFDAATRAMIDAGYSVTDVEAFRHWWRDNGHYDGKPALKSLVQHIKASVDGAAPEPVDEDMYQL